MVTHTGAPWAGSKASVAKWHDGKKTFHWGQKSFLVGGHKQNTFMCGKSWRNVLVYPECPENVSHASIDPP